MICGDVVDGSLARVPAGIHNDIGARWNVVIVSRPIGIADLIKQAADVLRGLRRPIRKGRNLLPALMITRIGKLTRAAVVERHEERLVEAGPRRGAIGESADELLCAIAIAVVTEGGCPRGATRSGMLGMGLSIAVVRAPRLLRLVVIRVNGATFEL